MAGDNLSLAGKVAIITGSGRENGIGSAIALGLARNGASVTLNYVSESSGPRAAAVAKKIQEFGSKVAFIQANLDTPDGAAKLVQGTLNAFATDHIDTLVNNAGYALYSPSFLTSAADVEKTFRTNVLGPFFLVQSTVPHMPRGSRIVNIGSVMSKLGLDTMPAYSASKAAMDSLTFSWAAEFGRSRGITVNTVAPGPVATDIMRMVENPVEDPNIRRLLDLTLLEERLGTIEEIADAVLLLASDKSGWITGQYISVSGGITGL